MALQLPKSIEGSANTYYRFRFCCSDVYASVSIVSILDRKLTASVAEEVSDAGTVVPRSMIWSYILNMPLTFAILLAFLFCIDDVYLAVDSPTSFAFMYVFRNAIGTAAGTTGLVYVILILNLFIAASVFAVTSRQLFAFARDDGVPASEWFAKVCRFQSTLCHQDHRT